MVLIHHPPIIIKNYLNLIITKYYFNLSIIFTNNFVNHFLIFIMYCLIHFLMKINLVLVLIMKHLLLIKIMKIRWNLILFIKFAKNFSNLLLLIKTMKNYQHLLVIFISVKLMHYFLLVLAMIFHQFNHFYVYENQIWQTYHWYHQPNILFKYFLIFCFSWIDASFFLKAFIIRKFLHLIPCQAFKLYLNLRVWLFSSYDFSYFFNSN